jgi:hypothetical protein
MILASLPSSSSKFSPTPIFLPSPLSALPLAPSYNSPFPSSTTPSTSTIYPSPTPLEALDSPNSSLVSPFPPSERSISLFPTPNQSYPPLTQPPKARSSHYPSLSTIPPCRARMGMPRRLLPSPRPPLRHFLSGLCTPATRYKQLHPICSDVVILDG